MMASSVVVSSPSSSLINDYIGSESCLHLDNNEGPHGGGGGGVVDCSQSRGKREQRLQTIIKREIPPPIPSLARNNNLPCPMPWVLKRYYTSDGWLILKEEKVDEVAEVSETDNINNGDNDNSDSKAVG
ncbi:hypothetical protein Godav_013351 [Gossypium davidsonii]|uniref:FAF domain-containing protein n=1 Tax=Gossypium davidsonii TaxID=34287 RepID=A0A7J8RGA3_GOSDV|nr:hypothetical protein [Gossypium davidsonii]